MREVFAKTILNKHRKRDEWFLDNYSLNPYQLCEFNCIYCYIHGSKYGERKDRLAVKINAPTLLEKELYRRGRRKEYGFIALSSATEPWMGAEEEYHVTRRCLEVIYKHRFPVHCLTKSPLILRDLDLLKKINENAILPDDLRDKLDCGAVITFSFSTLEEEIAKIFEPNAPKPKERLKALQKIKDDGLFCGIAYIPILPFISDSDEQLDEMIKIAKEFDVDYIFVGTLTLYGVGKRLYYNVLEKHFPELLLKYERLFKHFNQPNKKYQKKLEKLAIELCERYKVKYMIL
ncbi:radical SAM protein [Archaeoglobales archaeon]|nr:MAG: radical SAM protein [Archaeoglobales archaeon]